MAQDGSGGYAATAGTFTDTFIGTDAFGLRTRRTWSGGQRFHLFTGPPRHPSNHQSLRGPWLPVHPARHGAFWHL